MIGTVFITKASNTLTILESTDRRLSNGAVVYILECNICSFIDPELWYYGSITSDKYSLKRGQSPCGCSKPNYTPLQWKIRVDRVCSIENYEVLDYGELSNKLSTVSLHNPLTGNSWDATLHYLINQGRRDPWQYNMGKPDNFHVECFHKTGLQESKYTFKRSSMKDSQGKRSMWEVYCNICDSKFIRHVSDLKMGKIPCDCQRGGGYNTSASFGYLYVVSFELLGKPVVKFGITSKLPNERWKTLITNNKLDPSKFKVEILLRHNDAKAVMDCETSIKRLFSNVKERISKSELPDGNTEALYYSPDVLTELVGVLESNLPCPVVNHGGQTVEDVLPLLEQLPDNVIVYLDK